MTHPLITCSHEPGRLEDARREGWPLVTDSGCVARWGDLSERQKKHQKKRAKYIRSELKRMALTDYVRNGAFWHPDVKGEYIYSYDSECETMLQLLDLHSLHAIHSTHAGPLPRDILEAVGEVGPVRGLIRESEPVLYVTIEEHGVTLHSLNYQAFVPTEKQWEYAARVGVRPIVKRVGVAF